MSLFDSILSARRNHLRPLKCEARARLLDDEVVVTLTAILIGVCGDRRRIRDLERDKQVAGHFNKYKAGHILAMKEGGVATMDKCSNTCETIFHGPYDVTV